MEQKWCFVLFCFLLRHLFLVPLSGRRGPLPSQPLELTGWAWRRGVSWRGPAPPLPSIPPPLPSAPLQSGGFLPVPTRVSRSAFAGRSAELPSLVQHRSRPGALGVQFAWVVGAPFVGWGGSSGSLGCGSWLSRARRPAFAPRRHFVSTFARSTASLFLCH